MMITSGASKDSVDSGYGNEENNAVASVFLGIGGFFLGIGLFLLFTFPALLHKLASGKAYGHQAWLFGMEGYATLDEIEHRIWHSSEGRLKWSPYGSPLSAHRAVKIVGRTPNCHETIHVEGVDPMDVPDTEAYVNNARQEGLRVSQPPPL